MIKIGITGKNGFVGSHLYNTLALFPEKYELIEFKRNFFSKENELDSFVKSCDVIVHLAALNRHDDLTILHNTNIELVTSLISSLERTNSNPHVILSSSLQESNDNPYGNSKKIGRELLMKWASNNNAIFTGLIIPNVYGPFGKPHYNSVVATFSYQIARDEKPEIQVDGNLKLIYINELVDTLITKINSPQTENIFEVPHTSEAKVSILLEKLTYYKEMYQDNGEIPKLDTNFDLNLFNTYRCYIDIKNQFPIKFTQHTDSRGSFVEIIRLGVGGQVSFSTTVPGITRGNHFHTRKIERFAVIKGKALIQLRKIGTDEVLDFYLDGNEPAYVDMPIWYTHNIKNIGDDVLYTNFWINETYNQEDADTYFENV